MRGGEKDCGTIQGEHDRKQSGRRTSSGTMISEQDHSDTFEPGDGGALSDNENEATQADSEQRSQQISRHSSRKRKERSSDPEEILEGQQLQRAPSPVQEESLKGKTVPGSEDKLLWYIDHIQSQRSEAERLRSEAEATLAQFKTKYARVEAELNATRAQMDLFFAMAAEMAPQLLSIVNTQLLERSMLPSTIPSAASLNSTSTAVLAPKIHPSMAVLPRMTIAPQSTSLPMNSALPPFKPRPSLQQSWLPSTSIGGVPQLRFATSQPVLHPLGQPPAPQYLPSHPGGPRGSIPGMLKAPVVPLARSVHGQPSTAYPNLALPRATSAIPSRSTTLPRSSSSLALQQKPQPEPEKANSVPNRPRPTHPEASAFRVVRSSHRQSNETMTNPPVQRQQAPSAAIIFEMAKKQALSRNSR